MLLPERPPDRRRRMSGNPWNYGLNLGMAYGLLEQGISREHVTTYLGMAHNSLSLLPSGQERTLLEKWSITCTVRDCLPSVWLFETWQNERFLRARLVIKYESLNAGK